MDLKISFIQNLVLILEKNDYNINNSFKSELKTSINDLLLDKINQFSNFNENNNNSEWLLIYFIINFTNSETNESTDCYPDNENITSIDLINKIILNDQELLKIKNILKNWSNTFKIENISLFEFINNYDQPNNIDWKSHLDSIIYLLKINDLESLKNYINKFNLDYLIDFLNGGVPFDINENNYKIELPNFMINLKNNGNYNWIKWIINNNNFTENNLLLKNLKIILNNNFDLINNEVFDNNLDFINNFYYRLNCYYNCKIIDQYIKQRKSKKNVEYFFEDYRIIEYFNDLNEDKIYNKMFDEKTLDYNLDNQLQFYENIKGELTFFEYKFFDILNIYTNKNNNKFYDFYFDLFNDKYELINITNFFDFIINENIDYMLVLKLLNSFHSKIDVNFQIKIIKKLINSNNLEIINEFVSNYYNSHDLKILYFNNSNRESLKNINAQRSSIDINIENENSFSKILENYEYLRFYKEYQVFKTSNNFNPNNLLVINLNRIYDFFDLLSENNLFQLFDKKQKNISYKVEKIIFKKFLKLFNKLLKNPLDEYISDNIKINLNFRINFFILTNLKNFDNKIDDNFLVDLLKYVNLYNNSYLKMPGNLVDNSYILDQNKYFSEVINNLI